jgi:exonuclease III
MKGHPDTPPQKKNQQKSSESIDSIEKMNLTDIYRVFHPVTAQYTFFYSSHGTFSKIDYILGHKASFGR